jgi:hypothetical protein
MIAGHVIVTDWFPLDVAALEGATGASGTVVVVVGATVVVGAAVVVVGGMVVVGGVPRVTVVEAAAPVPPVLVAVTETVYVALFDSPVRVQLRLPFASAVRDGGEHVWPVFAVTTYAVASAPFPAASSFQVTVACPFPATALTDAGAHGADTSVPAYRSRFGVW